MPLIINGVEIENLIVINTATGEQVDIETLQDQNGNILWQGFQELPDIILNAQKQTPTKTVDLSGTEYTEDFILGVTVSAGEGGASVTYGGITKQVEPNTEGRIIFGKLYGVDDGTPDSGLITISGDYYKIRPCTYPLLYNESTGLSYTTLTKSITDIVQWQNSKITNNESMFNGQALTEFKVSKKVKVLQKLMFSGNLFSTIDIPSHIEEIQESALPTITNLFIPKTIKKLECLFIGNGAETIVVDKDNSYYTDLDGNCVVEKETMELIQDSKNTVLKEGLKSIRMLFDTPYQTIPSSVKTLNLPPTIISFNIGSQWTNDFIVPKTVTTINGIGPGLRAITFEDGGTEDLYINGIVSSNTYITEVVLPDRTKELGDNIFASWAVLTNLTIGANCSKIGKALCTATSGALSLKKFTAKQPSGMYVELPSSGMFDCKTASTLSVYTDNEYIKNYNYSGDGVTATIYHLDGTAWE